MLLNAIVIQGNCRGPRTREVIDYALEHNPNSFVIFSTWSNFDGGGFVKLQEKNSKFRFVQSAFPTGTGSKNRHFQRWNTYWGIQEAVKLGATHILKMRSDQLLRKPNICEFLMEQLNKYGEDRLIVGNVGTTHEECWGQYHISDWWMFGKSRHLQNWYDISGIDATSLWFRPSEPVPSPEPDFVQTWMERQGIKPENLNELLAKHFIVIDNGTVELIYIRQPINAGSEYLTKFWERFGDPKTIRHTEWLKLFSAEQRNSTITEDTA